jgi:hypothetical protein
VLEIEARSQQPLAPDAEPFAEQNWRCPAPALGLEIYPRRLRIDEDTMHVCVHSFLRAVLASTVVDPEHGENVPFEVWMSYQYLPAGRLGWSHVLMKGCRGERGEKTQG